jgi:hypothetical protein
MTKKLTTLLTILLLTLSAGIIAPAPRVQAHRDGCHRWHSCPSDSGSYICGDLGYTSECPGGAPTTPRATVKPAKPRTPVVSTKTITTDEVIAFTTIIKQTGQEYSNYSKLDHEGANGLKRTYYEVTLTDGVETARKLVQTETVVNPIDKVTVQGNRQKPVATVTDVHKTKKKDKYDIRGKYKPDSEVVLALDGKRIKRAKTNSTGEFIFKQIKLKSDKHAIEVFKREKRTESKVSDKVLVNAKKNKRVTEYDQLHGKKL